MVEFNENSEFFPTVEEAETEFKLEGVFRVGDDSWPTQAFQFGTFRGEHVIVKQKLDTLPFSEQHVLDRARLPICFVQLDPWVIANTCRTFTDIDRPTYLAGKHRIFSTAPKFEGLFVFDAGITSAAYQAMLSTARPDASNYGKVQLAKALALDANGEKEKKMMQQYGDYLLVYAAEIEQRNKDLKTTQPLVTWSEETEINGMHGLDPLKAISMLTVIGDVRRRLTGKGSLVV